jgi:hypothetical protein
MKRKVALMLCAAFLFSVSTLAGENSPQTQIVERMPIAVIGGDARVNSAVSEAFLGTRRFLIADELRVRDAMRGLPALDALKSDELQALGQTLGVSKIITSTSSSTHFRSEEIREKNRRVGWRYFYRISINVRIIDVQTGFIENSFTSAADYSSSVRGSSILSAEAQVSRENAWNSALANIRNQINREYR